MFCGTEIIDLAIQIEQNGEHLCRAAAQREIDSDLASLLEWMADQEAQHIKWFSGLKLKAHISASDSALENFGRTLLREVLGDQSFSLNDADFSKLQQVKDLLSLLLEFERDTILFYEMLQAAVDDTETIVLLDTIIAEEVEHIARIKDYFRRVRAENLPVKDRR